MRSHFEESRPNVTQNADHFTRPKEDAINIDIQFLAEKLRVPRIEKRVRAVLLTELFQFGNSGYPNYPVH
jgi:hypothetical protein